MSARRISERYRRHLSTIALFFVRSGRNKSGTARRVKAELSHLASFKADRLDAWEGNAEWEAAVESAEQQSSADRELPPDVRGSKLRRFANAALARIEQQHDAAKEESDEKLQKELEARLLKIHEALRNEERHQENLKTQERLRDFRAFVANVVALAVGCNSLPEYEAKLREAAKDPAKLMGVTIGSD